MTDVLAVRNEFRLQNWMEIIRECEESGLSNRESLHRVFGTSGSDLAGIDG